MKTSKTGFTLIELLVVIAIIAILAAILFPVFAKAKEAAKKAADLSNQKQAGLAQLMYCPDSDDLFAGNTAPLSGGTPLGGDANRWWGNDAPLGVNDPNGGAYLGYSVEAYKGVAVWTRSIAPYLKNEEIMRSPADTGGTGSNTWEWTGKSECPGTNWKMNGGLMGASQTQVPEVANLIMYRSVNISHRIPNANPHMYYSNGAKNWASYVWYDSANDATFGDGCNVTYADGHSKYKLRKAYTVYEMGNTNADPKQIFPEGYWYVGFPWRGTYGF
jgi:prepilin-type N-terminal cleavage/methylation domain-containing protein/prepilin-type processing-associated H-X9-DG protein